MLWLKNIFQGDLCTNQNLVAEQKMETLQTKQNFVAQQVETLHFAVWTNQNLVAGQKV